MSARGAIWKVEGWIMKPISRWLLTLAIVLCAFYLLLIPEFGVVPFWGQRWEQGAPPPWRESAGWWGRRFGYGMMYGPAGDWEAGGVDGDNGYGYGMMGRGGAPWSGDGWQATLTPQQRIRIGQIRADALRQEGALQAPLYTARADLLALNAAAKPDPAAQAKASAGLAEVQRQIVQIRIHAERQIQAVLNAPPQPVAPSSVPAS